MFWVHPKLALITLIPVPFIAAGGWINARLVGPRAENARESAGGLTSLLHDNIAGIRQIKSYTLEPEKQRDFDRFSTEYRRHQTRLQRAWAIYGPGMGFLGDIGLILLVGCGAYWCIMKEITIGQLTQFLMLIAMLYEPISRMHGLSASFIGGLISGRRVFEIINMTDAEDLKSGESPDTVKGEIRFENVSFRYDDSLSLIHI